jgi:uncharacterized protein YecT (DUF1311 family)
MAQACNMWAASFNCAKAQSPLEKAICSNPTFSAADDELNAVWRSTMKTFPLPAFLRTSQQFWLKETATCTKEQPGSCVNAFRERTALLKNLGRAKVYTNYGKDFSIDLVTLVLFESGTDAFIWMYGDFMPDMNHPEPPPNGFLLDDMSRLRSKGKGKYVIEDQDCEVTVTEDQITFDQALLITLRQAQLEGVFERVR